MRHVGSVMTTGFDHLVIGAASLDEGVAYVKETLGAEIPAGGEHPLMGTHNHLMKLSDSSFLEIIAINPEAPPPSRPRWFGLDDALVRSSLAQPRLLAWVVNTPNLNTLQAQTSFDFGEATKVSRGNLTWDFAIPEDGRLLAGGTLPYLIQWHTQNHPARNMARRDCSLIGLEIHHPYPEWLGAILTDIGAANCVTLHALADNAAPFLKAHIGTSNGTKVLSSRLERTRADAMRLN